MSLVSRIGQVFGSSPTSSTGSSEDDNSVKINFRYVDAIASVIGLAQIAIMNETDPKLSFKNGRLYPKYRSDATQEWAPKSLKANEMPHLVQSAFLSLDRYWNGDSREELVFFNYALPYVAKLYPANSEIDEQNKAMKKLWGLVKKGVDTLEDSYRTQLKEPLKGGFEDNEISEYDDDDDNGVIEIKNRFRLPLQQTLGKTFTLWKTAIDGFVAPKVSEAQLDSIVYDPAKTISREGSVDKEDFGEGDRVQSVASGSGDAPPSEKTDKKKGKTAKADGKEIAKEDKKEAAKEAKKAELISLEQLLKEFQAKLTDFKKQHNDQPIIDNLHRVIAMTLKDDAVPKKLFPLSEKIKKLWTLESIQEVLKKFEDIKAHKKIEVTYAADVLELNKQLDKNSMQYADLIREEFDEVITL